MCGKPHRVVYFWRRVGNRFSTLISKMLTNTKLTDIETFYKMAKRVVIQPINIKENRLGIKPEITAKIARGNYRIYEIGISYFGRTYAEGKKIGWRDGIRATYALIKYDIWKKYKINSI